MGGPEMEFKQQQSECPGRGVSGIHDLSLCSSANANSLTCTLSKTILMERSHLPLFLGRSL